jgi:hypothetical protein
MEQEHQADDRDDHGLLNEGVLQRRDRAENQLGSVVRRYQLHAFGQLQQRDLLFDGLNDL